MNMSATIKRSRCVFPVLAGLLVVAGTLLACGEADISSAPTSESKAAAPAPTERPRVSTPAPLANLAPDFTLPSVQGVDYNLSSFRGDKPVAVVFYRAYL